MCMYFTMLLYMKIQTERKHHVFVFHHFPFYEDTDREETPCFFSVVPNLQAFAPVALFLFANAAQYYRDLFRLFCKDSFMRIFKPLVTFYYIKVMRTASEKKMILNY
jgi:hypothetical protein